MITKVNSFDRQHILVVGDVMIDEYVYGRIDRMSPEAPVPVVLVEGEHSVLGGAGNVVNNLAALGAKVMMAGVIGDDTNAKKLMGMLERTENIDECLVTDPGRVTTRKARIVSRDQQVVRVDREMTYDLTEDIESYFLGLVGQIGRFDAVIISDYGKGVVTPGVFHSIMEQAEEANVFVAVDPNGTDYSKYRGANIITPNYREAVAASGSENIIDAAEIIMEQAELPQLLITRGKHGMDLHEHRDFYHIDTEAKEVFDVSGAGDTVIAAFTLAVSAGYTMKEAAYISNVAAGIVVGKMGTATVSLVELEEELNNKVVR